jgi:hypothetical protein
MLGLLLERGQSYADISGLLGVDESEVRSRAHAALAELGGGDHDRNVGLSDYLLGQADPIGRADAVRHLREDPDDRARAERALEGLAEVAPSAELPSLPGEARTAPHLRPRRLRRAAANDEGAARKPPSTLSGRQGRLLVALASGAVILAVAIAAVAGAFSGGSSSDTVSTPTTTSANASSATGGGSAGSAANQGTTTNPGSTTGDQTLTPVTLNSVGGNPGKGLATFGLASQNTPFLDVQTTGLTPAQNGQVYSVWLVLNPKTRQGYPVAPLLQAHDRWPLPSVVLPILPKMQAVDVVASPASVLRQEIKGVLKAKKPKLIISEPGNLALRGTIPKKTRG